jgi:hypothetical protein
VAKVTKVLEQGLLGSSVGHITQALDLTQGIIRVVQKFSRHRDVRVIERHSKNKFVQSLGIPYAHLFIMTSPFTRPICPIGH